MVKWVPIIVFEDGPFNAYLRRHGKFTMGQLHLGYNKRTYTIYINKQLPLSIKLYGLFHEYLHHLINIFGDFEILHNIIDFGDDWICDSTHPFE